MIDGVNTQCDFCNTRIRLRFQMGYFDIPFDFCCPECGAHISGTRKLVDASSLKIQNATVLNDGETDCSYYIDLSVELLQRKITKYESIEKLAQDGFSPFLATISLYGHDEYQKLVEDMAHFLSFRDQVWKKILPLYDLYFNKKFELTKKPLFSLSEHYTIKNELDVAMSLHQLTVLGFHSILDNNVLSIFEKLSAKVLKEMNPLLVDAFIEQLGGKLYFKHTLKRLNKILDRWIKDFEGYIPAVMLIKGNVSDKLDKECYGISTTSFDNMKSFFADSYELILEMMDIAVGLNNIAVRGTCGKFNDTTKIDNWASYQAKTKASKIIGLVDGEPFSRPIPLKRHVRNAIAHYNYEFDASSQKISFSDRFKGAENLEKLYLIDLAQLCYENVSILLYFNELMYSLRKRNYMREGLSPNIWRK